jgi:transposase
MVHNLFKHIQGKNGSQWANFIREIGSDNLLFVAVDAAKYTHKALISNYYGEILVHPFEFDASLTGFNKLVRNIQKVKCQYGLQEVVLGIETTGHYYEDLTRQSCSVGFHVRIINAATTAEERKAILNSSKTDNLDLMAILISMIHGRGSFNELPSGSVHNLQRLTRARRELVQQRSAIQNQIHAYVDHIFREFEGKTIWKDGKKERVRPISKPFGKASIYIMRHCLHPSDILSLGEDGLRKLSIKENLKLRDQSIERLLDFAKDSISQPKECVEIEQILLNHYLDLHECYNNQIRELERQIEDLFVRTDGAIILSVCGIGVVTGAELYGEMGDISDFNHAGQLIKMAGTNPIVKQSGDRRPSYYAVSRQGRKAFRNIIYQVGKSLASNNPEMNRKYRELKDRGKHPNQAYIALGNRMVRLAFSMIKHQTLYRTNKENYILINEINKKLHKQNVKLFFERFVR